MYLSETFRPWPNVTSIRFLAALDVFIALDMFHFGVEQAFVQSDLQEVVYV